MAQDLLILQNQAPGDIVVLTAFVRDLALTHPDRYRVFVHTSAMELWEHNPHCIPAPSEMVPRVDPGLLRFAPGAQHGIRDGIHRSQREPVSYLGWNHALFTQRLGVVVPPQLPYPDIHLSDDERTNPFPGLPNRYWVIAAGGKADATVKIWPRGYWQDLVNRLADRGIPCVQTGKTRSRTLPEHIHHPLQGVWNTLDRAPMRELIRLIHHADGVICGLTLLMHMAAALHKPCVVIAGGRENWAWEAYVRENAALGCPELLRVPHRFLHSGVLAGPGCQPSWGAELGLPEGGCWKNWTVAQEAAACGKKPDGKTCAYPEQAGDIVTPRCMALITPRLVEAAVMDYYEQGIVPPVELDPAWRLELQRLHAPRRAALALPAPVPLPVLPSTRVDEIAAVPQAPEVPAHDPDGFDHEAVGGKLTLLALLYGDYPDMHRRFLDALVPSLVPNRVDVRLISQQLTTPVAKRIDQLVEQGIVRRHYRFATENLGKYVRLRAALRDPELPIETSYVVWLDDDSLVRDPTWLRRLAGTIAREHPAGARLFGPHYVYTASPAQREWIRQSPWYRGVELKPKLDFVLGSLFALNMEVVRELDLPDPRLSHQGDWTLGAALTQAGWKIAPFSQRRELIAFDSAGRAGRRGRSEPPPGAPGWKPYAGSTISELSDESLVYPSPTPRRPKQCR